MDCHAVFSHVENNIHQFTLQELKDRLSTCIKPRVDQLVHIPAGSLILRARLCNDKMPASQTIHTSDLVYPAADQAVLGRLNRQNQPIFYGSFCVLPALYEVENLSVNDDVILSVWRTENDLKLYNIGYTEFFGQTDLQKDKPLKGDSHTLNGSGTLYLKRPIPADHVKHESVDDWIHDIFIRKVHKSNEEIYYLSIAIGELCLEALSGSYDGIIYPSAQVWPEGDNLMLYPDSVDRHLQFEKAFHLRLTHESDSHMTLAVLAHALSLDQHGILNWQSYISNERQYA